MKKLLDLPHKVCRLSCMVNGLEDLYEWQTDIRLPDWLFFYGSGLGCGFTYLRHKRMPTPRRVVWGTSTQRQYANLAEIVGFTWRVNEGRSFAYALAKAKAHVEAGQPIVLGALDMYHLPYVKFYHQFHIPIHYVLMVGYDDEREGVWVQDCDRTTAQWVPYADLEAAWNTNVPGLSQKNTFFVFDFDGALPDPEAIARRALRKQATFMLQPPARNFGLSGMRKLARELPHWPAELPPEQLDASLRQVAEYAGMPPTLPNRLTGHDAPNNHRGGRDGFAALLLRLEADFGIPGCTGAATCFEASGEVIAALTEAITDYLLGESSTLGTTAPLLERIADLEERGYARLRRELS